MESGIDDDEEEMEDSYEEEGESESYDSEAEEGIQEMIGEGLLDSSNDYDEELGEDEYSEDSFEAKYGEKRIEVLEESLGYKSSTRDDKPSNKVKHAQTLEKSQPDFKRRKSS